jgi:cytochrome c-type biogenesis protein CcmH
MKFTKILFALILTLLLRVMLVGAVSAQQPTPSDDQVNQIAKQLYCPVCENIPLDVCPTTACAQWRELIREKLADGWTEQQIKDYFVLQYGDRVLGTPPAKGINWLVYLVPPIAILAGVYILFRAFRSWKRPVQADNQKPNDSEVTQTVDPDQDEYINRLEEEIRKR